MQPVALNLTMAPIAATATTLVFVASLCSPAFASTPDEALLAASSPEQSSVSAADCKCPKSVRKLKPHHTQPSVRPVQPKSAPVCPACPVAVQPVQTPSLPPPPKEVSGFWNRYGKDTIFMLLGVLLGTIVSLYGTIVFERYKRFREILLDISQARLLNNYYPIDTKNLEPIYQNAIDYWRTVERKRWSLDADGHHEAAAKVERLQSFAYKSALCIEHLLNKETRDLSPNNYLSAFQLEFNRIVRKEDFTAFERRLRPNISALLQPYPHPYSRDKAITGDRDSFFADLLN